MAKNNRNKPTLFTPRGIGLEPEKVNPKVRQHILNTFSEHSIPLATPDGFFEDIGKAIDRYYERNQPSDSVSVSDLRKNLKIKIKQFSKLLNEFKETTTDELTLIQKSRCNFSDASNHPITTMLSQELDALNEALAIANTYPNGRPKNKPLLYLTSELAGIYQHHTNREPTQSQRDHYEDRITPFEDLLNVIVTLATFEEPNNPSQLAGRALAHFQNN